MRYPVLRVTPIASAESATDMPSYLHFTNLRFLKTLASLLDLTLWDS